MRWTLLLAAGCLISLSVPGQANWFTLRVSKPSGTWSEYLDDSAACNTVSQIPGYQGAAPFSATHFVRDAERTARSIKYWDCMVAKGYRADPNGYRAASVYYSRVAPRYTHQSE
jgi:hypothetical protein